MNDIARQYRDAARAYIKKNGRHTPTQLYEILGLPPDGFRLKADGRGSVSIESFTNRRERRTRANDLRVKRSQSKGIVEDSNYRSQLRIAKTRSDSTLHRYANPNPSIVEHDVALRAGGSNSYTSISDPLFKQFKDNLESKVYSKFGDKYVVDIDDVSGGARVIPRSSHNKYQPTSKQPGFTVDLGDDISALIKKLNGNGSGNGNGLANGNSNSPIRLRAGIAKNAGKALKANVAGTLLGFLPEIDEITGGHINKALNTGMDAVKNRVEQSAEFYTNLWADRQAKGYDLHIF